MNKCSRCNKNIDTKDKCVLTRYGKFIYPPRIFKSHEHCERKFYETTTCCGKLIKEVFSWEDLYIKKLVFKDE